MIQQALLQKAFECTRYTVNPGKKEIEKREYHSDDEDLKNSDVCFPIILKNKSEVNLTPPQFLCSSNNLEKYIN